MSYSKKILQTIVIVGCTFALIGCGKSKPQSDLGISYETFEKNYNAWAKESNGILRITGWGNSRLDARIKPLIISEKTDTSLKACADDSLCINATLNPEKNTIGSIAISNSGLNTVDIMKATVFKEAVIGSAIGTPKDRSRISSMLSSLINSSTIKDGVARSETEFNGSKVTFEMLKDSSVTVEITKPFQQKQ